MNLKHYGKALTGLIWLSIGVWGEGFCKYRSEPSDYITVSIP